MMPLVRTDPVSGEGLCAVLVVDPNISGRLDPGLSVHLHRYTFISQNRDLHCSTLMKTQTLLTKSYLFNHILVKKIVARSELNMTQYECVCVYLCDTVVL